MEKFKVNSGFLKGRKVESVNDKRTKYTPLKVKQSVFSMVQSHIDIVGTRFLDLCAASGQIGVEAISCGASHTTFVDLSPISVKTLKKNVTDLGISQQITIVKQDVVRYLKKTDKIFDIVFIDTPFVESIYIKLVSALLKQNNIISKNGVIIVETQKRFEGLVSDVFDLISTHEYGTIRIDLYKHKEKLTEEENL